VRIGGWSLRFQIYSVPGQEAYARTRRAMLSGVDGVVFVADASPDRIDANRASFEELAEQLQRQGSGIDTLPLIVQVNKMDRAADRPAREVAALVGAGALPMVESVAVRGIGVRETLQQMVQRVAHAI
jgi:signal recognition particle receptor subunit beta